MGRREIEKLQELKDVEVEITEKEFKIARSIARRYNQSMCGRISSEDIEQEIMMRLVIVKKMEKSVTNEEPKENLAYAKSIMENKARDLFRANKREKERLVYMDMNGSCRSDEGQEQAESVLERLGANIESFEEIKYSEYEAIELITKFMENEVEDRYKSVVIAMGYVNSGLEFLKDPYEKLVNNLDEDKKEILENMLNKSNGKMTNDIAYRIFGGLETGVNSGSAWKFRSAFSRLKRLANGEDIKDVYAELKRA